jgi:hypothetical protein
VFRHLLSEQKNQSESALVEASRIEREMTERASVPPSSSTFSVSSARVQALPVRTITHETEEARFDFTAFQECAKRSLPLLKKIIHLNEKLAVLEGRERVRALGSLAELRQQIAHTQGQSTQSALRPRLTCGKFLGRADFSAQGIIEEEVKILYVLTFRSGDEAAFLLKTAIASHHDEAPQDVSDLWMKFWKKLSLKSAFARAPLPTVDELKREVITEAAQVFERRGVRMSGMTLDDQVERGLSFANEIIEAGAPISVRSAVGGGSMRPSSTSLGSASLSSGFSSSSATLPVPER